MADTSGKPVNPSVDNKLTGCEIVTPQSHHKQEPLCLTRPKYRQGRKLTAVKVYTINDESVHLLIIGVPSLKLHRELNKLCRQCGTVKQLHHLEDYPCERFTEAYTVKYNSVRESRRAKQKLDGRTFFGGSLHVCYAPELEDVSETWQKINERRIMVNKSLQQQNKNSQTSSLSAYHPDDKLACSLLNMETDFTNSADDYTNVNNSIVNETVVNLYKDPSNVTFAPVNKSVDTASSLDSAFQANLCGPSLGSSYNSMAPEYEAGLGECSKGSLSNIYKYNSRPTNKRKASSSTSTEVDPELNKMPKSMRVFKSVKKKRKDREDTSNSPFIGPLNHNDALTLKSWNTIYDNNDSLSCVIEKQQQKNKDVLNVMEQALSKSLFALPEKSSIKYVGNTKNFAKITVKEGVKLL